MTNLEKLVVVLGASPNPERVSFTATNLLLQHQYPVYLCGIKTGSIKNIPILPNLPKNAHTVTLYLGPNNQQDWIEPIIKLAPKRVIFNPGTENPEFMQRLTKEGIFWEAACTLVLLKTNQFEMESLNEI